MFTPSRFNAPSQEIETSLTSPLPGCKIEQSCFPRSKYYSEIYGEFFGSLLPLEPTSMTTVEHRRDKDMVPILVEIELKVNHTIIWQRCTNEGTFVPSYEGTFEGTKVPLRRYEGNFRVILGPDHVIFPNYIISAFLALRRSCKLHVIWENYMIGSCKLHVIFPSDHGIFPKYMIYFM